MSVNDTSVTEDTDMAESDGDKVVTMMDVLQEQQDFEDDANAVLGASDDKECTYSKGYIKRQAVYACLTCCSEARDDPEKRAGVCLACSLNCHENHELIELYTKRNFCCDCGNPKFNSNPCQFTPIKTDLNAENVYNQNFSGLYCTCHRPYPDPDTEFEDEMIQCVICEDWLHSLHLETKVPSIEDYAEMICKGCMDKNEFLHDYSEFAVNIVEIDNTVNGSSDVLHLNGTDVTNEITDQSVNVDDSINNEPSHAEKSIQEIDGTADESMKEDNGDISEKAGDIIDVKTFADNEELNEVPNETNIESIAKSDSGASDSIPKAAEQNEEQKTEVPEAETANVEEINNKEDENNTENAIEPQSDAPITEENTSEIPEISSAEKALSDAPPSELPAESSPSEPSLKDPTKEDDSEATLEPENTHIAESTVENAESSVEKAECAEASDTKPEEEAKIEEANVESKQISSLEAETAVITAAESDNKPDENTKMEDTTLETHQTDSTEEKANDLNLESNTEVDKTLDTTEIEKPETVTTETTDSKETNGDAIDVIMAEGDTLKTEIAETPITINAMENELLPATTNAIENEASIDDITNHTLTNGIAKEIKRKHSTEDQNEEELTTKKPKLDSHPNCTKPKNIKKVHKGATFWPGNFRQHLCKCNHCLAMYKDLSVLFLIDNEDTVSFYEALGKEKSNGTPTQYERGMEALSSLDRIQQINALTEYNLMRDKLLDFLKSFKERKEVVKEEDIKAFFAGMKPKREPDGVYFCR